MPGSRRTEPRDAALPPAPPDLSEGARPARFVQLVDFLDPGDFATLRRHVEERLDATRASSTVEPRTRAVQYDETVRRSHIVADVELVWPLFESRLTELRPTVCDALGIPPFEVASVERQLTMHGDGDFFQRHRDEQQPGTDGCRVLTFVYYFHDEPKQFEGGELRLYDSVQTRRGQTVAADTFTDVEPAANSIVFFGADAFHEVLPVRVAGPTGGIGRCTLNGWFHAGDLGRPLVPFLDAEVMRVVAPRLLPRLTAAGFTVRTTPEPVQRRLLAIRRLWDAAGHAEPTEGEEPTADDQPTRIPTGPFGDEIMEALRPVAEDWTGTALHPVLASPLRVHRRGQQVPMHVSPPGSDVVTALLLVEEDVDTTWPLELEIGGERRTVPLAAGQMALYEGAAIPHGMPVPLAGPSCCTMLVHYRPVEWAHDADWLVRRALSEGLVDETGALVQPSGPAD